MKLKQECVRYVLICLENQKIGMMYSGFSEDQLVEVFSNDTFSADDIRYTLYQLANGGMISAKPAIGPNKLGIKRLQVFDITWKGHEFLDAIRDDKVWSKTKKVASTFSSVSLGILQTIASKVIVGLIKEQTGLPL